MLPVARDSMGKLDCSSCFFKAHCCIGSKAACLVLLWNFAVLLVYRAFYNIDAAMQISYTPGVPIIIIAGFSFIAVFSPVAGLLMDIKFSRHKAVLCSSYAILMKMLMVTLILVAFPIFANFNSNKSSAIVATSVYCGIIISVAVYVIFLINAFQFGMDQLHDSPTEDSILFIHWYVWIYYSCTIITETALNLFFYDSYNFNYFDDIRISGLCTAVMMLLGFFSFIALSLCVFHYRKVYFLLEPAGVNPYKLVYKVTKFVYQHKVPLRRSAFTYCTEELPSRMDVGKHKYGGPFTTKQVEDVKAFWGILKVVLTIGPAFLLQTVTQSFLPTFAKHSNMFIDNNSTNHHQLHLEGVARYILISNGLLSPLLVVICIPLYLCWIRQHIRYHVPGMLKRIGLAIFVMVLSLVCTFVMDLVVHLKKADVQCIFQLYVQPVWDSITFNNFPAHPLYQNTYFFTSQHVLSAIANMLLDIAVLEFICSQSPYSMKGLLLGIFFSVKSLFQGIAIASIVPFGAAWNIRLLSCGSGFYLMYVILGVLELVLFICVAKRYKYREVNEPSHEYRYAEDYYSNIQ